MPDSILTYIKKLLGIDAEETDFDPDIILFINSAIAAYYQIGVGERFRYYRYKRDMGRLRVRSSHRLAS